LFGLSEKKTPLARRQGVEGQGPVARSLDDNPARIILASHQWHQSQGACPGNRGPAFILQVIRIRGNQSGDTGPWVRSGSGIGISARHRLEAKVPNNFAKMKSNIELVLIGKIYQLCALR